MRALQRGRGLSGQDNDQGSVTPLVLGMTLCLLLLCAGVIAAGSAVLARRNLQSVCDGATAAAAGGVTLDQLMAGGGAIVSDRIADYLRIRRPDVGFEAGTTDSAVTARCQADAPVAFGVLFAHPTVHLSVDAVSRIGRR